MAHSARMRPPRPAAWQNYMLLISTEAGMKARVKGPGAQGPFHYGSEGQTQFKREYMNRTVKFELKHIPRGERGSLQNFLRFSYSALRRKHFTLGLTKHETLRELIDKIRKAHPDFNPEYDRDYFKI